MYYIHCITEGKALCRPRLGSLILQSIFTLFTLICFPTNTYILNTKFLSPKSLPILQNAVKIMCYNSHTKSSSLTLQWIFPVPMLPCLWQASCPWREAEESQCSCCLAAPPSPNLKLRNQFYFIPISDLSLNDWINPKRPPEFKPPVFPLPLFFFSLWIISLLF